MTWWLKPRNPPADESTGFHPLQDAYVKQGGAWRSIEQAYVKVGGNWRLFYTNIPSISTSITASASPTSFDVPGASTTISGTVTPASGSIPVNSLVELRNGSTVYASARTTSGGAYTMTYSPATAGGQTYRVRFVANGAYLKSETSVTLNVFTATTTQVMEIVGAGLFDNSMVQGQSYIARIRVLSATGQLVNSGTVKLYWKANSSTNYVLLASGEPTNGGFDALINISKGNPIGNGQIRATFTGPIPPLPGATAQVYRPSQDDYDVLVKSPPVPSPFAVRWTTPSWTIAWNAQDNATGYNIIGPQTGLNVTLAASARSYKVTLPGTTGTYSFYVRAFNDNNSVNSNTLSVTVI